MKKQILVIDDELSHLKLLTYILSEEYDLVTKEDGADAITWLGEGNDPSLIISDLEMPYIDGSCLVRNLKISGYYRNTPVILLSGADNFENIIENMPFQANCSLKKPLNPFELKSSILAVFSQYDITTS